MTYLSLLKRFFRFMVFYISIAIQILTAPGILFKSSISSPLSCRESELPRRYMRQFYLKVYHNVVLCQDGSGKFLMVKRRKFYVVVRKNDHSPILFILSTISSELRIMEALMRAESVRLRSIIFCFSCVSMSSGEWESVSMTSLAPAFMAVLKT